MTHAHYYEEQFDRVKRYYGRFEEINAGRIHDQDSEEYRDDVHAFFQNCFHLKDWIKNDDSLPDIVRSAVEAYVNGNYDLNLCGDICNGAKHLKLDKKIRTGKQPQLTKTEVSLHMGGSLGFGPVSSAPLSAIETTIIIRYTIETAQGSIDAFDLATRCIDAWKTFLQSHLP